jgi:hypothetical protein
MTGCVAGVLILLTLTQAVQKTVGREVASGRGCLLFGSQAFSMFQTL